MRKQIENFDRGMWTLTSSCLRMTFLFSAIWMVCRGDVFMLTILAGIRGDIPRWIAVIDLISM
jgi:hypothetical protein